MLKSYKSTIVASCTGYIIQAVLINLPPLLFITFQNEFGLSMSQLSILIASNFITEFIIDFVASRYIEKIGYRLSIIIAQMVSTLGLLSFAFLPSMIDAKFVALIIASILCGIGGGLMEVLVSPLVEACPTKNKSGMMSLLHSFYCWGQVAVVLLSTIYFKIFGIENWRTIAIIWAILPAIDLILFLFVPIFNTPAEKDKSSILHFFKQKTFLILLVMMLCAGASELAMSQWASAFAEAGLNVPKWIGDLLGPCLFAVAMGSARVFYSKKSEKISLEKGLLVSSLICIISYSITIFSPFPILSLFGCALCGVGCGMLWPGTFSLATKNYSGAGIAMFGLLALAGDMGCLVGPTIAGQVSNAFGENLKVGFAVSMIFPIILAIMVILMLKAKNKDK